MEQQSQTQECHKKPKKPNLSLTMTDGINMNYLLKRRTSLTVLFCVTSPEIFHPGDLQIPYVSELKHYQSDKLVKTTLAATTFPVTLSQTSAPMLTPSQLSNLTCLSVFSKLSSEGELYFLVQFLSGWSSAPASQLHTLILFVIVENRVREAAPKALIVAVNKFVGSPLRHLTLCMFNKNRVTPTEDVFPVLAQLESFRYFNKNMSFDSIVRSLNQYAKPNKNLKYIDFLNGNYLSTGQWTHLMGLDDCLIKSIESLTYKQCRRYVNQNGQRLLMFQERHLNQICNRFSSLTKLFISQNRIPYPEAIRAISQLKQLKQLTYSRPMLQVTNEKEPQQPQASVPSLEILSFVFAPRNHQWLDQFYVVETFPNIHLLVLCVPDYTCTYCAVSQSPRHTCLRAKLNSFVATHPTLRKCHMEKIKDFDETTREPTNEILYSRLMPQS